MSGTDGQKWVATQLIVWEFVTGCRSTSEGYACTDTKFIDGICAGGANPGVKSVYNAISKSLANYSTVPSFASAIASKAETYEMKYSDGKYTLTLTDSNSILSEFSFNTTSGISVTQSGNKLTLTSSNPVNDAVTFSSAKSLPNVGSTTLVPYGDATLQDVITGVENDAEPIRAYFKVKTSSGNLKLVKTSEDGNIANIEFIVKGDSYNKTVKTNSKGEFVLTDLVPGTYTVTENTDEKYAKQESKTVKVESGKTATVSFTNILKKWKLTVTKTDAETKSAQGDATLSGAVYGIYNDGKLIDKYTTKDGMVHNGGRRYRYLCSGKAMKRSECDGQSVYSAARVDEVVLDALYKCFDKIKATPKDAAIEKKYKTQISQIKIEIKRLNKETETLKRKLGELTEEIANSLLGDSKFTPDVLSMAIETTKGKIADNVQRIAEKQNQLNNKETDMSKIDYYYEEFVNWADEFGNAPAERQRMILCKLFKEILVGKGYSVQILMDSCMSSF